jgi:hypothetical protein
MKRVVASLALLGGSIVVCLVILEFVLRLFGFYPAYFGPDRTLGYRLLPHARYRWTLEGFSHGRFNAAGWRDRDYTEAKPAGTTRILFLGDSYVEALQVPLDSTFHKRLERALNARAPHDRHYEVIALGQSGNGTTQEYLTYKTWGVRYDPDVVAVLYILNDPADNWPMDAQDPLRPYLLPAGDTLRLDTSFVNTSGFRKRERMRILKEHSSLVALTARTLQQMQTRAHPNAGNVGLTVPTGWYHIWSFEKRPPADSIPAFQLTERILARFARDVQSDGRRFVVFVAGAAEIEDRDMLAQARRDSTFDPDKTMRWMAEVGRRERFEVVPLTPAFRAANVTSHLPLWNGTPGKYGHWNSRGHAVAETVMEDYLTRLFGSSNTTQHASHPVSMP